MSALTRYFFRHDVSCRTPSSIIGWWEARRLTFNVAVGAAGLVTLAGVHLIARLPPSPFSIPVSESLVLAAVYGVAANMCYSGGWLAELAIRRGSGSELEPVGPALLRYGFVFSIGLTLFPIAFVTTFKIARVAWRLFGMISGVNS
jgi:hypothetical protein